MFFNFDDYSFYIRPGKTDMRKRSSSLSFLIQDEMELNPFEKSVFVFCSGNRTILKAIVWDKNGFWEITKRYETGSLCWPKDEKQSKSVSIEQLKQVLEGQNPWRQIDTLSPTRVC